MKTISTIRNRSTAKRIPRERRPRALTSPRPLAAAPLKLKRILVPVDFSKPSRNALNYALSLAEQFGSAVTLVHIVEPVVYPNDWVYPISLPGFPETEKALLARLKSLTSKASIPASSVVRAGRAWKEIINLATEQKCDLIVIATHGYTGLAHAFMGSVAEKVVRHADCPVLTLRANGRGPGARRRSGS